MQGKTHFVVGIAVALGVLKPQTFPVLIAGGALAGMGGVLSDIDAGSSSAHKDADRVIAVLAILVAGIVIADINLHLGIYEYLLQKGSHPRQITILAVFLALCAFGKSTKHRSFMHSFVALGLLSACVYLVLPQLIWYFVLPFVSHLVLDVLTRRRVLLFWPGKKGFCLGLCNSSGWLNGIFFSLGLAAVLFFVFTSVPVRNTGTLAGEVGREVFDYVQGLFRFR